MLVQPPCQLGCQASTDRRREEIYLLQRKRNYSRDRTTNPLSLDRH
eukprot:COSAG02_NODE_28324_length_591_cov_1.932927_1_plen_45_part_01